MFIKLVGRDTVCVVVCDSTRSGQCDTTIIVVVVPPTTDTIRKQLPMNVHSSMCRVREGYEPIQQRHIAIVMEVQAHRHGTLGSSVLGTDGCITYTAGDKAGKEAPTV